MNTKHTPGPWEVGKHATPPSHPQFGIYADGSRNDHCIVTGENAQADAHLIALAPELLEALLDIEANLSGQDCRKERIADSLRRAREAINRVQNP